MLAVELLALTAFAVAQPVYELVADNPTFLVAHRVDGIEVLWYALVLLLLPPAGLAVLELAVATAVPSALNGTHAVLAGLLVSMTVTPPLARGLSLGTLPWFLLFVALAGGAAWARWARPVAATVLRFAALAAPAFLALFLVSPEVRALLSPADAGALDQESATDTSVLWVVLDELPLGALLDPDGELDTERFPGFAALADVSTWYPEAMSSSTRTNVSVLSALTGQHPDDERVLPVASQHPVNAFSLLGADHRMAVSEAVTQLCPRSVCGESDDGGDDVLWSDTWTVLVRSLTPDDVADRLVPETDDRWAGFGDNGVDAGGGSDDEPTSGIDEIESMAELFDRADDIAGSDQREMLDVLVDGVAPTDEPVFTFVHALVPHIPYRYLPGGLAYDRVGSYGAIDGIRWVDDEIPLDHMMQRLLLQTQYADEVVGRLVERLRSTGRLDDTLVIVMSDHGVSMTPGTPRREHDDTTVDDMLTIPLFIHYPERGQGTVDRRPAQPVDLLPTLADVVGAEIPPSHALDGDSLVGPPDTTAELTRSDGVTSLEPLPDVTSGRVAALKTELFPPGTDFWSPRPHGDLVGQALPLDTERADDLTAELAAPDRYDDLDPDSGIVPAHVVGTLDGRDEPVDLAVGIGGTVAGVGTTYRVDDGWQISVMVDPAHFEAGANDVTVWEIRSDGLAWVPRS